MLFIIHFIKFKVNVKSSKTVNFYKKTCNILYEMTDINKETAKF